MKKLVSVRAAMVSGAAALVVAVAIWPGLAVFSTPTPDQETAVSEPVNTLVADFKPDLVFAEPVADLGVRKGLVDHRFRFRNTSEQMVSIRNIDPSCTCTLVNPDRTEVPPGEEGSFGVQVDLAKLSRGAKRFQVVVSYDLNGARRKALEIALVNDPDIQFIPDRLTLSGVIGEKLTGQITIVDYRHHLMSVKAIHSDFDSVTFTALETPKAYSEGWRHVFEVSVDTSKMPSGRYFPVINAVCDPPLSQPLKGSLDLNVLPRISLRPSSVVLDSGSAEGGQVVKFIELRDQLGDSKTIELQEIVCPHPRIKCDFIRAVEGHGPKLRLAWNTSEGVGSTRAVRISIRVRKPCQQEVTAYLSLR